MRANTWTLGGQMWVTGNFHPTLRYSPIQSFEGLETFARSRVRTTLGQELVVNRPAHFMNIVKNTRTTILKFTGPDVAAYLDAMWSAADESSLYSRAYSNHKMARAYRLTRSSWIFLLPAYTSGDIYAVRDKVLSHVAYIEETANAFRDNLSPYLSADQLTEAYLIIINGVKVFNAYSRTQPGSRPALKVPNRVKKNYALLMRSFKN